MNKDEENNLIYNDLEEAEMLYLEERANFEQRLKVLKHIAKDANSRIAFQIAAQAQIAMEPWKYKSGKKWNPDFNNSRHERQKGKFSLADFKKIN